MSRTMRTILIAAALTVLLAITGCSTAPTGGDPKALQGDWKLVSTSATTEDVSAIKITAKFEADRMMGFSGVNQYSGGFEAKSDGSFKVGQMQSTLMAGPEPAMAVETAYLRALGEVDMWLVEGEKLTLSKKDGDVSLVYERVAPFELVGSKWEVRNYNNGKEAVVGVSEGATLTIEFGADKTASGSGGVNNFTSPYEVIDDTITITNLASTKMMGPEDLMEQEQLYFTALQNSATWSVDNDMLTLRDGNGATQVVAVPQGSAK